MSTETVKYVRLQGNANLGIADDGRLTLHMCQPERVPLPGVEPIFFSFIPGTAKGSVPSDQETPKTPASDTNPPLRFLNIDMLVQFNKKDFDRYQPLWDKIQPELTWDNAWEPTPETMPNMNPTGPPRP